MIYPFICYKPNTGCYVESELTNKSEFCYFSKYTLLYVLVIITLCRCLLFISAEMYIVIYVSKPISGNSGYILFK